MTKTNSQTYFEPVEYINNLMYELGFENASDELKKEMYKGLSEQVTTLITNAVALYVEPEEVEEALIMHGNLEDFGEFIKKLIEISPEAQMAIVKALDHFYEDMLERHKRAQARSEK